MFCLGVAAVWLVLVSLVAMIAMSPATDSLATAAKRPDTVLGKTTSAEDPSTTTPTTAVAPTVTAAPAGAAKSASSGVDSSGITGVAALPPSTAPGDTTGVTDTEIHIGIHAPETVGGAPLNLADDPIKGLKTYAQFINDHGGIWGRKLVLDIQDDGASAESARQAAATMINDHKDFLVSGTLGIDQIAIVAAEAYKRGVPYLAGGGSESKPIPGMFQLTASYQTMVQQLAAYMKTDPNLKGKRVGILASTSQYINPAADDFKHALQAAGFTVATIVNAQGPTENPDYNGYILQFRQANTQVVVPLTDPVTTSQIVQRCVSGAACGWTYSFVDFAHDWDLALKLMTPTWEAQSVRGLATSCYYRAAEVDNVAKCGAMAKARDQYVAVNGQDAWNKDGSGAAFGYQIISMIKGALWACGRNLTRQRFVEALRAYNNYGDLVTGPITFAGSTNTMHGSSAMAVYEAQPNETYKMVSPGMLGGF
jgi:ABC-type branched-subunit amino acid transport system substrate-binding protein